MCCDGDLSSTVDNAATLLLHCWRNVNRILLRYIRGGRGWEDHTPQETNDDVGRQETKGINILKSVRESERERVCVCLLQW